MMGLGFKWEGDGHTMLKEFEIEIRIEVLN